MSVPPADPVPASPAPAAGTASEADAADWPVWLQPPQHLAAGAGPAGVARALSWLEALGEQQGWSARTLFALTLCADEALTNIASHARTPQGTAAQLWLACGPTPHALALCIEDDGTPFDPTAQDSPQLAASLEQAEIGGHGLRLMRHYLHRMLYRRIPDRNVLLLEVAL